MSTTTEIQEETQVTTREARDARILELSAAGLSSYAIAEEVGGITRQTVNNVINKYAPKKEEPPQPLVAVALDRIDPNPWQPRTNMDPQYISELAEDIYTVGLLHDPMVRPAGDGVRYQLAHGHSRVAAVRLLHESDRWGSSILVKVDNLSDDQMAYIALSENRARKNLTTIEEISAWAKAVRDIDAITIQSLADRVGIDRGVMSRYIDVLDLPKSVLELVDSGAMSLRAAREFLALRNTDHCHADHIELVLKDLSGQGYQNNPPDYRTKTVRKAIRGVATGRHAYGWVNGLEEASRTWRPLNPKSKHHNRTISFDVEAFKAAFPTCIHTLPEGEDSGGTEWTCNAREWGRWSSQATRAATVAARDSGSSPSPSASRSQNGKNDEDGEWWRAVKRDPVVQEIVGKGLRAMKSPAELTEEHREALGSRVERPNLNNAMRLPQEAQPEGVTASDHAPKPPRFDFSQCATCTQGAAWALPQFGSNKAELVCVNKQAWLDKRSVGMQSWVDWKDGQAERDATLDVMAIGRLSQIDGFDARGLLMSLWGFVQEGNPVEPLSRGAGLDWNERTRYNYWPVGAETFAQLTGLKLPELHGGGGRNIMWEREVNSWLTGVVGDVNWSAVLASVLVWQARVNLGIGADIWGSMSMDTDVEEG